MTVTTAATAAVSARRVQTREKLMAAAVTVFAERGVNGASVEEICEAAGFTRGAFYSNFTDKSALVLALIQASMDAQFAQAQAAVDSMMSQDAPVEQLITRTLDALFSGGRVGEESVLADQELRLQAARDPELRAPYLAFVRSCREQIAALIGGALDHLGLALTVPFDDALTMLIATHEHQQLQSVLESRPVDGAVMRSLLLAITSPANPVIRESGA